MQISLYIHAFSLESSLDALHLVHMHFYKEPLFVYHMKKNDGWGGGRGGRGGGKMSSDLDFFFKNHF